MVKDVRYSPGTDSDKKMVDTVVEGIEGVGGSATNGAATIVCVEAA